MAFEILLVFCLILLAMVLSAMDSVPFDLVAMILMSSLMLPGVIEVKEGLSGFSNPATVTIAAMFALSKGIQTTGLLRIVSRYFSKIGRLRLPTAVFIIMGIIALISAFINNTAAVVIFIPVLMSTTARMEISPSKLLMPLSFAPMFGGVCTLLGTSTNILVSPLPPTTDWNRLACSSLPLSGWPL
jgi:di/tricarboxylate transporter